MTKNSIAQIQRIFKTMPQAEPSPELHARLLAIVAQVEQGQFARQCGMQPTVAWTDAQMAGYVQEVR